MESVHNFVSAEPLDVSSVDVKGLIRRTFSCCFDNYECLDAFFLFESNLDTLLDAASAIILGE